MLETYKADPPEHAEKLRDAQHRLEKMQWLIAQPGVRLFTDFGSLSYHKGNEWFLKQHFGLEAADGLVEISSESREERDLAGKELKVSQLNVVDVTDPDKILFSMHHEEPEYKGTANFNGAPNFGMFLGPHGCWFTSVIASSDDIGSFEIIAPEEHRMS